MQSQLLHTLEKQTNMKYCIWWHQCVRKNSVWNTSGYIMRIRGLGSQAGSWFCGPVKSFNVHTNMMTQGNSRSSAEWRGFKASVSVGPLIDKGIKNRVTVWAAAWQGCCSLSFCFTHHMHQTVYFQRSCAQEWSQPKFTLDRKRGSRVRWCGRANGAFHNVDFRKLNPTHRLYFNASLH